MQSITMLIIRPRAEGSGIFDLIAKATNSALAKKIITTAVNKATNSTLAKKVTDLGVTKKIVDSALGKTLAENITKENFQKAANSAIGKQLKKVVADKVDDAFDKATKAGLEKLQFRTIPEKVSEKVNNPALPPGTKRPFTEDLPIRKKGKRRKIGNGIIYQ